MRNKSMLLVGLALLSPFAIAAQTAIPPIESRFGAWGVDLSGRDMAVKPGDDFWRHANGTWFRQNPIPADRTSWGVGPMLSQDVDAQVRTIMETAGQSGNPTDRQVADLYAAFMDEAGIEARGLAPLRPHLARVAQVRTKEDMLRLFGEPGFASPVSVGIIPNPADPTRYIAAAGQSGLGMGARDFYLREGANFDRIRAAYRDYIIQLHRLAGIADPEVKADAIIALERQIAEAHWTAERSRDITQLINPMNRAQLNQLAPQFRWTEWLEQQGLGDVETIIAAQTTAITAAGQLFERVPLDTWKAWQTFHVLSAAAPYLPQAFDQAHFNFFSRVMRGAQQQPPRWRRALATVNGVLGESVGRIYLQRHFPAESRRQMHELIANLRGSLQERLERNSWMDEPTRREALAKLAAFDPRVGGPDSFLDYGALRVDRADLIGTMLRAGEFQRNLMLSRLPKPVDRSLWAMTPQTINAYYSPLSNQITFPAAILQPPYFNPRADPAVNYGAIGAVIGHEIGHAFDDQGSRFDAQGRLREWWTPEARQRFQQLTARLGAQYAGYEAAGQRVNPQLTMGENIGDLGGLEMAYGAYRRHVAQYGEPPVIDGLTGDQRFFLAFAQTWRRQDREDTIRQMTLTDPHSPAEFRANGVVRNVDAWYQAFNVQPGDRLYLPPDQRVRIW